MGDSVRNIGDIKKGFPAIEGLELSEPVEGNDFDFNSLKDCKMLIICTSSQYGMPPPNFKEFAHQLLLAATSNPGCLSHLQHTVYGNGDETYFNTYMNMPRYVDRLLEKCGSRRFYARGETGEPHADVGTKSCKCLEWTPAMWTAAAEAVEAGSEHHQKVTEWNLEKLVTKLGELKGAPSAFS